MSGREQEGAVPVRQLFGEPLPLDFSVGVILGASGSGKTLLLRQIRARLDEHLAESHTGLGSVAKGFFIPDVLQHEVSPSGDALAVASRSEFFNSKQQSVAIQKLSCVGFNKIPGWLTPYEQLSNGEQSRARLAMHLQSDVVVDNFCGTIDNHNSCAVAASLGKMIQSTKARRVLIATTKQLLVPFLKPDFVIIARTAEVIRNPETFDKRGITISWKTDGIGSFVRQSPARWDGEVDQVEDVLNMKRQYESLGRVAFTGDSPVNELVLRSTVFQDAITAEVSNAFEHEFDGLREQKIFVPNLKLSLFDAPSGAIIGPSGSGKTTALRTFSGNIFRNTDVSWEPWARVDSYFASCPNHAYLLEEVCLLPSGSSLRPFATLSTGEKQQAEIARVLAEGASRSEVTTLLVDEFTSNLDRSLACKLASNMHAYLESNASTLGIRLIVAGIYEDVLSHFMPSWVLHSRTGTVTVPLDGAKPKDDLAPQLECDDFARQLIAGDSSPVNNRNDVMQLLRPPKIEVTIRRLPDFRTVSQVWEAVFKEHHYLQGELPNPILGFLARHGPFLVGLCSSARQWGGGFGDITYREARLVVLPEYSGFGLGPRLSDIIAQAYRDHECRYLGITAHPRLGGWREISPLWIATKSNLKKRFGNAGHDQRDKQARKLGKEVSQKTKKARIFFSHEFAGSQGILVPPVPPKRHDSTVGNLQEAGDTAVKRKAVSDKDEEGQQNGTGTPCKVQRTSVHSCGAQSMARGSSVEDDPDAIRIAAKVHKIKEYLISLGGSCELCKIAGVLSSKVGGGLNLAFMRQHFQEAPAGSHIFSVKAQAELT